MVAFGSAAPVEHSALALRAALDLLRDIGDACTGLQDFARRGVDLIPRLVASDLTTLSVCDLDSGHRYVVSDVRASIGRREIEVFDHYFFDHPLVRAHGRNPQAMTCRISDLVPDQDFHRTPLFNEYYRAIHIDHVMAVPLYVDDKLLVSFVLNRANRGFDDHERALLDLIRPQLANLYRLEGALESARPHAAVSGGRGNADMGRLTAREREVLEWVIAGKTNRDIGQILGAQPRTVEKHLERIYEKLGVETRTAAAMRAFSLADSAQHFDRVGRLGRVEHGLPSARQAISPG